MATEIGPRIKVDGEKEYRQQMSQIIAQSKTLAAEMKNLESGFSSMNTAEERATTKAELLNRQIDVQRARISKMTAQLKKYEAAGEGSSNKANKLRENIAKANTELGRMERELSKLSGLKKLGQDMQDLGNKITSFSQKVSSVGKTMTKYVTVPLAAAGAGAIKMATGFETAMAKVSTISDGSVGIETMSRQIMDLSNTTGIASVEIADNVYNAISAGQKTGDAVNFVSNATKLAKSGFTESADALDILTTIMNAYGIKASDVTKVSDKLITTQNLGKTTIAQLAGTMGTVIPTAQSLGVNLDNVASAYVTLTKNGISTNEATTYLNAMLNELGKSGSKSSEILQQKTGKSFAELMRSGRSLSDVLAIVEAGAEESGVSLGDCFSNARAKKGAQTLTQHVNDFDGALAAMNTSLGATESAFQKMSNTTQARFNKALQQVKNTGITAGQSLLVTLAPAIEKIGDAITRACDWFNDLDESQRQTIMHFALLAAAVGPATTAIGAVGEGLGNVISVGGQLIEFLATTELSFAALAGPIAIAGAALVGFAVYCDAVSTTNAELVGAAEKANAAITEEAAAHRKSVGDAQELASTIKRLNAQESLSADQKLELASAVQQLNAIMPELNLSIDENTGKVSGNTAALEQNIDAALRSYEAQLKQEEISDVIKTYSENTDRLAEAQKRLTEAQEEQSQHQAGATSNYELYRDRVREAQETVDQLTAACDENKAKYEELTGSIMGETSAQQQNSAAQQEGAASLQNSASAADGQKSTWESLSSTQQATASQFAESVQSLVSNTQSAIQSQTNWFEQFNSSFELSSQTLLQNLQSQIQGITTWEQQLNELADRGINQDLLQRLMEMGPQGAQYVNAFASMSNEELAQANDMWSQALDIEGMTNEWGTKLQESGATAIGNAMTGISELMPQFGADTMMGLANGISENAAAASEAATQAANQVITNTGSELGVSSPSWKTQEMGVFLDQGLANGILQGTGTVQTAVAQMVNIIMSYMQTTLGNTASYQTVGSGIVNAISVGIIASSGQVASAASTVARQVGTYLHSGITSQTGAIQAGASMATQAIATGIMSQNANVQAQAKLVVTQYYISSKINASKPRAEGVNATKAFAEGILSQQGLATGNARSVAAAAANAFGGQTAAARSSGYNLSMGFANGISAGRSAAVNAAASMAAAAVAAANAALKVGSPSRVMYDTGHWTVAGFVNALNDGRTDVARASAKTFYAAATSASAGGLQELRSTMESREVSPELIYEAIRQGASDATLRIVLNNREVTRALDGLGVAFA